MPRKILFSNDSIYLQLSPFIPATELSTVDVFDETMNGVKYWGLKIVLSEYGGNALALETSVTEKKVAFVLRDRVIKAATVQGQITNDTLMIYFDEFKHSELEDIKSMIEEDIKR